MAKSSRVSKAREGAKRLGRLDQGSLSERAYEVIRSSIISGRLGPGERLVEEDLAGDLGVSRAPIREAFRRLADEQLVVEKPRYGTYVGSSPRKTLSIYTTCSAPSRVSACVS